MNRRMLLVSALALPAGLLAARTMPNLGVFCFLGDFIEVSIADAPTDTRIDRKERRQLDVPAIAFDNIALVAVRDAMGGTSAPGTLMLYRAPQVLTTAQQRDIAQGARKAELPSWIVQAIGRDRLTHVLLVTRGKASAAFPTADGVTIGRGAIEGIGYHIDPYIDIVDRNTRKSARGALGAHVLLELTLLDAASGELLFDRAFQEQTLVPPPQDMADNDPWAFLTPTQRAELLRTMVRRNAARAARELLKS